MHDDLQTADAHGTTRFLFTYILCCALQDNAAAGNGVHAHLHSHAHKPEDEDLKAIFDLQEYDLAENKIDMPTGLGNCTVLNLVFTCCLAVLRIRFIWPKLACWGNRSSTLTFRYPVQTSFQKLRQCYGVDRFSLFR